MKMNHDEVSRQARFRRVYSPLGPLGGLLRLLQHGGHAVLALAVLALFGCAKGSQPRQSTESTSGQNDDEPALVADAEKAGDAGAELADAGPREPTAFIPASAEHPFLACDIAVGDGDEPLIADFEQSTPSVLDQDGRAGTWFLYDDGTSGVADLDVDPEAGVLLVTGSEWGDWGFGFGATLGPSLSAEDHCYYDGSVYVGLRFRARGKGRMRPMIQTVSNTLVSEGGTCTRSGENCYDLPGAGTTLTDEWQEFEYPFCGLQPEGWGGEVAPVDPGELLSVQFRVPAGQTFELELDDLSFFTAEDSHNEVSCEALCPLDAAPFPETIQPENTTLELDDELTLHTFAQETPNCGPLTRRYLSFVPSTLEPETDAPVLLVFHGSGANAETMQDFQTHGRLDELAAQDGVIVIYGNAAPGEFGAVNTYVLNSGSWRLDYWDDGQVDDAEYVQLVLADLQARAVISGDNPLYLAGQSNGGGMVMELAKQAPELFRGVAPFMAYDGTPASAVPDLSNSGLTRVLFAYSEGDPGVFDGYYAEQVTWPAAWARALGLPQEVIDDPVETPWANAVNEGEDYEGTLDAALFTRNSTVTQWDIAAPDQEAQVRVFDFAHAGHFWPHARQDTEEWALASWGFRNQDLDGSDVLWDFFFAEAE